MGFMEYKKVTIDDIPVISKLAKEIWPKAYGSIICNEQLDYMLNLIYSPDALKNQIENLHHQFIIAVENETPIGYASYSLLENDTYKLHKLYILQDFQCKGVGKNIINNIISLIDSKKPITLRLNVNRYNPSVVFYKKIGFEISHEEDIEIGNGFFMNDYVMEKTFE